MAPLRAGLELLESAIGYTLGAAGGCGPALLRRPTPCQGWDLETLLDHVSDSIGVLCEAISAEDEASVLPRADGPAGRLRCQAVRLLGACAAPCPAGRPVTIRDRALTPRMVTLIGAIEIAVHGWDISVACGACRPIPPGLALIVLPLAPLLITPDIRPGLFADPVPLPGPACPGDQLVAFLGRQPRVADRGDSGAPGWSI